MSAVGLKPDPLRERARRRVDVAATSSDREAADQLRLLVADCVDFASETERDRRIAFSPSRCPETCGQRLIARPPQGLAVPQEPLTNGRHQREEIS